MTSHDSAETTSRLDAAVCAVADRLPNPVVVHAAMGGTGVLQIILGQHPGWVPSDPLDCAGIDAGDLSSPSLWWVDVGGGERTAISSYGPDANPRDVAQWVATTYAELAADCQ